MLSNVANTTTTTHSGYPLSPSGLSNKTNELIINPIVQQEPVFEQIITIPETEVLFRKYLEDQQHYNLLSTSTLVNNFECYKSILRFKDTLRKVKEEKQSIKNNSQLQQQSNITFNEQERPFNFMNANILPEDEEHYSLQENKIMNNTDNTVMNKSNDLISIEAYNIKETYLTYGAYKEVILYDFKVNQQIRNILFNKLKLKEYNNLFLELERILILQLKFDIFPRFVRSKLWNDFLKKREESKKNRRNEFLNDYLGASKQKIEEEEDNLKELEENEDAVLFHSTLHNYEESQNLSIVEEEEGIYPLYNYYDYIRDHVNIRDLFFCKEIYRDDVALFDLVKVITKDFITIFIGKDKSKFFDYIPTTNIKISNDIQRLLKKMLAIKFVGHLALPSDKVMEIVKSKSFQMKFPFKSNFYDSEYRVYEENENLGNLPTRITKKVIGDKILFNTIGKHTLYNAESEIKDSEKDLYIHISKTILLNDDYLPEGKSQQSSVSLYLILNDILNIRCRYTCFIVGHFENVTNSKKLAIDLAQSFHRLIEQLSIVNH
ncbi:hypothetical protein ABK040_005432 [Willaertia magna]